MRGLRVILGAALLVGWGICFAEEPEVREKPSWFEKDEQGVLWFQPGEDGETKYSSGLVLSGMTDGIVIVVRSNGEVADKAIEMALKMSRMLAKSEYTPDEVPVVAVKDNLKGASYVFYTDGLGFSHDTIGKKGVFGPSGAKQVLSDVLQYYVVMRDMAKKGEWDDKMGDEKALQVRNKSGQGS